MQMDRGRVVGSVLEPCRIAMDMSMQGGSGQLTLDVSNIRMNLSPDILELALSVQTSLLEPLVQPAAEQPVAKCSRFTKVGSPCHLRKPGLGHCNTWYNRQLASLVYSVSHRPQIQIVQQNKLEIGWGESIGRGLEDLLFGEDLCVHRGEMYHT